MMEKKFLPDTFFLSTFGSQRVKVLLSFTSSFCSQFGVTVLQRIMQIKPPGELHNSY